MKRLPNISRKWYSDYTMIIKLTQGLETIIDDEDFDRLRHYKYRFDGGYAVRTLPIKEKGYKTNYKLHHDIVGKPPKGMHVDHINRNKLDNRKENLRIVTPSENVMNKTVRKDCVSGYKGVVLCKSRNSYKQWRAHIQNTVTKKLECVGYFETLKEAVIAYNKRAEELRGKFAVLNEIR